jgi:hypothetical protein
VRAIQNAFVESFNGRFRDECLSEHWFGSLAEAREVIEEWRQDYTQFRPHSSLGHQTPIPGPNPYTGGLFWVGIPTNPRVYAWHDTQLLQKPRVGLVAGWHDEAAFRRNGHRAWGPCGSGGGSVQP